jgi:8-amino-7-oxononanoate synthase
MRLEWLQEELSELERSGLLRHDASAPRNGLIDVASNDYLGYARRGVSRETLDSLLGISPGAGASRLISGTDPAHLGLEEQLAEWVGSQAALTFTSGYLANLTTICALVGAGDCILSDSLNHASIIDGCRLSRADVIAYPHLDLDFVREKLREIRPAGRTLVVTEARFSMDGDGPDLSALAEICVNSGAMMMVDEAHSLGVEGPRGAGRCRAAGVTPDVFVGTFGKALGTQGAFVAGGNKLRQWLWNKARGFGFSTALSPIVAALTSERVSKAAEDDPARDRLRRLESAISERLSRDGIPMSSERFGPIFPIILGSNERVITVAKALEHCGFQAAAVRPPTVPQGLARLRISLNADLAISDVERLASELIQLCA